VRVYQEKDVCVEYNSATDNITIYHLPSGLVLQEGRDFSYDRIVNKIIFHQEPLSKTATSLERITVEKKFEQKHKSVRYVERICKKKWGRHSYRRSISN